MGSEHRDAILSAATETFARFGFRKTSIDDIARRARIGKGTVYKDGNAQGVYAVRSPRLVAAGMTACLHGLDAHLIGPAAPELKGALAEVYDVFVRGLLAAPRSTRTSEA